MAGAGKHPEFAVMSPENYRCVSSYYADLFNKNEIPLSLMVNMGMMDACRELRDIKISTGWLEVVVTSEASLDVLASPSEEAENGE